MQQSNWQVFYPLKFAYTDPCLREFAGVSCVCGARALVHEPPTDVQEPLEESQARLPPTPLAPICLAAICTGFF